jgi:hypothetical protein
MCDVLGELSAAFLISTGTSPLVSQSIQDGRTHGRDIACNPSHARRAGIIYLLLVIEFVVVVVHADREARRRKDRLPLS